MPIEKAKWTPGGAEYVPYRSNIKGIYYLENLCTKRRITHQQYRNDHCAYHAKQPRQLATFFVVVVVVTENGYRTRNSRVTSVF